jgi:hypothetical protein
MSTEPAEPSTLRRDERDIAELRGASRDQRQSLDLILQELGGIRWEQRQQAGVLAEHSRRFDKVDQRLDGMDQRMTTGFTEIQQMLAEVVNRLGGR